MPFDKVYKLALVGCGRFGKNYIKTIEGMPNVEITHLCTSNPENAKLIIKNKVKVHKQYTEIFDGCNLDGIIICTPAETHAGLVHECIYHLLPTMVEKPLCTRVLDATTLQNYVKNSYKVPCFVDNTQLYNPAFQEICKVFKTSKPKEINTKVCSFGPFRENMPMLWDWAPHDISMCLQLLKEMPLKVKAKLDPHENYYNSGELYVELCFKNTVAKFTINNLSTSKYRSFSAVSSFNTMTMFDHEVFEVRGDNVFNIKVSNEKPLKLAIDAFIETIETQSLTGLDLSVNVVRVLEKLQESLEKESVYISI